MVLAHFFMTEQDRCPVGLLAAEVFSPPLTVGVSELLSPPRGGLSPFMP